MHDIVERFVGRYQVWRDGEHEAYRRQNPLTWLAFPALVLIGIDIYRLLTSHSFTWSMFMGDAVLLTFIILYLRRSTLAWFIIPLFGVVFLVEAPVMFFIAPSRYPLRVRVFSFCMAAAFGIAAIVYGFVVRRRYKIYLQEQDAPTQSI